MIIIIKVDSVKEICQTQTDMDATTVVNLIIDNPIAAMTIKSGVMCAIHSDIRVDYVGNIINRNQAKKV